MAPAFSAPVPEPQPEEEAVPQIDFDYKPHLELTPTVEAEPADEAPQGEADDRQAGGDEAL